MHAPIALTMGDGAGIGPEIILKTLRDPELARHSVVYAAARVMTLTRDLLALKHPAVRWPSLDVVSLDDWRARTSPWRARDGRILVVDVSASLPDAARDAIDALQALPFGEHFAPFGHLQGVALEAAIDDAIEHRVAAICTAPLNKALFQLAGRPPTGHTEILAARTRAPQHVMMLAGERLRVALTTTHLPLQSVSEALSPRRILDVIQTTRSDLTRLYGLQEPRIAVAALNPHAGESGTMGDEEARIIAPAIAEAQSMGWQVSGPWPADTLFAKAAPGRSWAFDAVVCMYHDQALIPLKLLHFGESANITLGLPIIRTSVDHGTAYDIAGTAEADASSFAYALKLARRFAA